MDPNGGMTTYLGSTSAIWDGISYYTFKVQPADTNEPAQHLYFDEKTGNIAYAQNEGQPFVMNIPTGFVQKTFTDADFTIADCKTTKVLTEEEYGFTRISMFSYAWALPPLLIINIDLSA